MDNGEQGKGENCRERKERKKWPKKLLRRKETDYVE